MGPLNKILGGPGPPGLTPLLPVHFIFPSLPLPLWSSRPVIAVFPVYPARFPGSIVGLSSSSRSRQSPATKHIWVHFAFHCINHAHTNNTPTKNRMTGITLHASYSTEMIVCFEKIVVSPLGLIQKLRYTVRDTA